MYNETFVKVRFGETDALGHINNTSYFIYLEEARIKFFEELGYNMDTNSWHFILASTKLDFIDQGYFNQELKITTGVSRVGSKSFQIEHEILDSKTNRVISRGYAVIVHFNFSKQESEIIPEILREKLEQYVIKK